MLRLSDESHLLDDLKAVYDRVPKGKFPLIMAQASHVEIAARTGYAAAQLLDAIRNYILDPVTKMGGEASPFVARIDALVARKESPAP